MSRFTSVAADEAKADYSLRVELEVSGGAPNLAGALAGILTLGAVSACDSTAWSLTMTVTRRSDSWTRAYRAADRFRTSTDGSPPGCEAIDEATRPEIVSELVRALYGEMARERIFAAGE